MAGERLDVDYAKLKLSFRRLAQTVIDQWIKERDIDIPEQDKYALICSVGDTIHDVAHKVAMQIDYENTNGEGETKQ